MDPGDVSTYLPFTDLKSEVMQTWIGIGGGGFTDPGSPTITTWSDMCSSATSRAAFISSLEDFMTTWGFQGVDLDWEYPAVVSRGGQPYDTANFVSLVQEMRASWGSRFGISISMYVPYFQLKLALFLTSAAPSTFQISWDTMLSICKNLSTSLTPWHMIFTV